MMYTRSIWFALKFGLVFAKGQLENILLFKIDKRLLDNMKTVFFWMSDTKHTMSKAIHTMSTNTSRC